MKGNNIWLTWEDHRRSRELAREFGCEYVFLQSKKSRFIRYLKLSFLTIYMILKIRPRFLFCQNPSIMLAFIACAMKPVVGCRVIVDRHSNFKFHSRSSWNPVWLIFHLLSDYSLRKADITIVTNRYLQDFVNSMGGVAYVLPDKIPNLQGKDQRTTTQKRRITFISTFSDDEPIFEVIEAARLIQDEYEIYITGSYKKYKKIKELRAALPYNVTLTGFLPEEEYQNLLASSDALLVITTAEYTLTCGAYEAVSLGKPMILGETKTIRSFFNRGAVYTSLKPTDMINNIHTLFANIESYREAVAELRGILEQNWAELFQCLNNELRKAG